MFSRCTGRLCTLTAPTGRTGKISCVQAAWMPKDCSPLALGFPPLLCPLSCPGCKIHFLAREPQLTGCYRISRLTREKSQSRAGFLKDGVLLRNRLCGKAVTRNHTLTLHKSTIPQLILVYGTGCQQNATFARAEVEPKPLQACFPSTEGKRRSLKKDMLSPQLL